MFEVAFDESGNSGENLLDPAQPVYTLASVARREAEVVGPVAALLDSSPYAELKFSRLRTSGEGRQILAAIFESGLLDPQSARVVPVDKDWMIAGKMVDLPGSPERPTPTTSTPRACTANLPLSCSVKGPRRRARRSGGAGRRH